MVTITTDAYITSTQVCELLKKLATTTALPITLVLDNARYQRCKLVMDLAETLGIELLFLPPYSPNLNLIERLWKLVKKECLDSKYYKNFSEFSGAISCFLTTMHISHRKQLDSLLTLKFQLFTEEQIKNASASGKITRAILDPLKKDKTGMVVVDNTTCAAEMDKAA